MIDGGRVVSLFTTARYFLHDPFNNYYLLANLLGKDLAILQ